MGPGEAREGRAAVCQMHRSACFPSWRPVPQGELTAMVRSNPVGPGEAREGDDAVYLRRPLPELAPQAGQRTRQGFLLSNFHPGTRNCMATLSSRAPSPMPL